MKEDFEFITFKSSVQAEAYKLWASKSEASHPKALIKSVEWGVVAFHHWGPGLKVSPMMEKLWDAADVIVCCNPQCLPEKTRRKHMFPDHTGKLVGRIKPTGVMVWPK